MFLLSEGKMDIKLPYALKNGIMIHISQISLEQRGKKCECVCPLCGKELIARLGEKNTHHFAHTTDCLPEAAVQTMIHLLAKEILTEAGEIYLPKHFIAIRNKGLAESDYELCDCAVDVELSDEYRTHHIHFKGEYAPIEKCLISVKGGRKQISSVKVEQRLEGIVPDIILNISGIEVIVEIAVTHFVDKEKLQKIHELRMATLEIDLGKFYREWKNTKDLSALREIIVNMSELKIWLFTPNDKQMIENEIAIHQKFNEEKMKEEKRLFEEQRRIAEEREKQRQYFLEKDIKRALSQYEPETYQQLIDKHANEICKNKLWLSMLKKYPVTKSSCPDIINIPMRGEIMFGCDRRVWQGAIFFYMVYQHEGKGISCNFIDHKLLEWLKDTLIRDLIYVSGLKERGLPTHGDLVKNYMRCLMDEGYVWNDVNIKWNKYYPIPEKIE